MAGPAASPPVLIAGGGIGGLALSLALAQVGRRSLVLERRPEHATEGAGIQIGPNGVHVLRRLGVADHLKPYVGEPEGLEVHDGRSGRTITQLPLGGWIANRHGAPYWVAHRGDLHRALREAAEAHPLVGIRTGAEVMTAEQSAEGVRATLSSGETETGVALVGADGLWSNVRRLVAAGCEPVFVGATATRTVMNAARAGALAKPMVGLWLTPGVHVVHYPLRGGSDIAVVVIAAEDWQASDWDTRADVRDLRPRLAGFSPELTDVLTRIDDWRKWSLHRLPSLPSWVAGRIALLGDAAHPMLPYLAQGGVMALEDALVLARCIDDADEGGEAGALQRYEGLRRARTTKVQSLSQRNGRIYHMRPPVSWARDAVLRFAPGERLMAGLDWLYGWKP